MDYLSVNYDRNAPATNTDALSWGMNTVRGILRMIAFLFLCTFSVVRLGLWAWIGGEKQAQKAIRVCFRQWAKWTMALLGIKLRMEGNPPKECAMILPNHRSYIDVVAFPMWTTLTFVAKREVRSWPIIGWGGRVTRTVWVDRSSKDSRRKTREAMASRLAEGRSVIVFTEGTTYKAPELGELRPGMFYIAAEGNFPVVPVAIEYKNPDDAWIGKDQFVPHFLRCFGKSYTHMSVRYGEVMHDDAAERLRSTVSDWLDQNLREMRVELGIKEEMVKQ